MRNKTIGQILLSLGYITQEVLDKALGFQKQPANKNRRLGELLLDMNLVSEDKMIQALSKKLELPVCDFTSSEVVPADIIKLVPSDIASKFHILPLYRQNNALVVAIDDPTNMEATHALQTIIKSRIKYVLATRSNILEAISKYYGLGAGNVDQISKEYSGMVITNEVAPSADASTDNTVVVFVNKIIADAIKNRATDIHLEPYENELRIRYRIDGMLCVVPTPTELYKIQPLVFSRLKLMAGMNIAEKRLPQDGRINVKFGETEFDIRVATLPTYFGETLDLRLLPKNSSMLTLEHIGMSPAISQTFGQYIQRSHGIILVTGPTGHGKSTTLYAALDKINSDKKHIVTIEDPIEYVLRGVNQTQVKPQINYTFADGLRSILRQDPNVIMIGEIRDAETAEIAVRASLTGHLVFSTLHANDAASTVTRLLDMGIEPHLVSSSLLCVLAQRLIRKVCPECGRLVEAGVMHIKEIRASDTVYEASNEGCPACHNTGFHGRTGLFELLPVTTTIRELILEKASAQNIKKAAVDEGMITLKQDGIDKVAGKITTIDEIYRVIQDV